MVQWSEHGYWIFEANNNVRNTAHLQHKNQIKKSVFNSLKIIIIYYLIFICKIKCGSIFCW